MLTIYRPPSVQVVTLPCYTTCPAATNSSFCHPDIPEADCDTYPDPCPHFIVRGRCYVITGLTNKHLWHLRFCFAKKNIFSPCLRFSFLSETPKLFLQSLQSCIGLDWIDWRVLVCRKMDQPLLLLRFMTPPPEEEKRQYFLKTKNIDSLASGYKLKPSGKPWATNDS